MLKDEDCAFWFSNLRVLRFKDPAHVLWVPFHLLHSRLFLTFLSPACLSLWGTHGICVFSTVHFSDKLDVYPRCGRPPLSSLFPSPAELGPRGGYSVSHWSGAGLDTRVRIPEGAQSLAEPHPPTPAFPQFPVPGDLASLSCYCCYLNRPMSQPPEWIRQYPEDEILSSSISSFPPTAQCAETSLGQANESPPARP